MRKFFTFSFLFVFFVALKSNAQLIITPQASGQLLAQKLLGSGVTISNVTLTASNLATGFFKNISGTNLGLDSGIVLSSGRVKSVPTFPGMDGDGIQPAYIDISESGNFATSDLLQNGDNDLDFEINDFSFDAAVLEFDFIPLGDSIKFRYVFGSEEYPDFACQLVSDAFAFFIEGPGFPTKKNIALVPNTTDPITIDNINNVPGCGIYPQYYISNKINKNFTYNGHTVILTAKAKVQSCQTYHLKIVIADVGDEIYDSGVFLEAKSLSSNAYSIVNNAQTDTQGNSYVVEGCPSSKIKIKRLNVNGSPETVNLVYTGAATNGLDIQTLPSSVVIPANQNEVEIDLVAIADAFNENIETLTITALATGCASGNVGFSTTIQVRDFGILQLSPGMAPDTAYICRNATQLLTASAGFTNYLWNSTNTLNNVNIANPIATPITNITKYICTATSGSCKAKDSLNLKWKDISLLSKTDVQCVIGNNGQIKVEAGGNLEWIRPLQFSIDNNPYQSDSTFNNLTAGNHTVRIKDASGCIDSITVLLNTIGSNITATIQKTQPTCILGSTGTFTITPNGGVAPYTYALDGGAYQASNTLTSVTGVHLIYIKDATGCVKTIPDSLSFTNTIVSTISSSPTICEGLNTILSVQSNATSFVWSPASTLSNTTTNTTTASPLITTKYFVKSILGNCFKFDSVIVNVNPAPIANAGANLNLCVGGSAQLNGSGGVTYTWTPATFLSDPNVQNPLVNNATSAIEYTLTVKDANGCSSKNISKVKLTFNNSLKIFAGNDTTISANTPFQLLVREISNIGNVNYTWTNPYQLNNANISNPITNLDRDFEYYVIGRTAGNCEARDTIKIKVLNGPAIYIPSAFTPNGDKNNDILKPICVGIKKLNFFRVYNRYGELVFETNTFNNGWDGLYKGVMQNTGNFVWAVDAEDAKGKNIFKKGSTILLR
jgi:gliding motility-associated-like protein